MKTIVATCLALSIAAWASVSDNHLFPEEINQILGRIEPDMNLAKVKTILKTYYPEAEVDAVTWSGDTGVIGYKLTSRYSIAIPAYIDPKDGKSSFAHSDLEFYVCDWELKRRIDITFYKWDDETRKVNGKTSQQDATADSDEPLR